MNASQAVARSSHSDRPGPTAASLERALALMPIESAALAQASRHSLTMSGPRLGLSSSLQISANLAIRLLCEGAPHQRGALIESVEQYVLVLEDEALQRLLARLEDVAVVVTTPRIARARHNVEVGELARAIAADLCPAKAAAAQTAGFFHDVGSELLRQTASTTPIHLRDGETDEELAHYGMSHPAAGAWLCRRAGLSPAIVRAVELHHSPTPPYAPIERCVWLAEKLAHAEESPDALASALDAAEACGISLDRAALLCMSATAHGAGPSPLRVGGASPLTSRQGQILGLLAAGSKPPIIAQRLGIAVSTVHNTLSQIYRKLGVKDGLQATLLCRKQGWL